MSAVQMRRSGTRRADARGATMAARGGSLISMAVSEVRVNSQQMQAIDQLFNSNAIIHSARSVIASHLMSGGISMHRGADLVEPTDEFAEHLRTSWAPFVHDALDSLLKFGFVPVTYENHGMGNTAVQSGLPLATERKRKRGVTRNARASAESAEAGMQENDQPLVPMVPPTGSYDVTIRSGGAHGYARVYEISDARGQPDADTYLYVRQAPDALGNCCSPMAAVFDSGSFVASLTELALMAEASRSRPHLITQLRRRDNGNSLMDTNNLFFDSEARQIQSDAARDDDQTAARALAMQRVLCQALNVAQTRNPAEAAPDRRAAYVPPDVQPSVFCLPAEQEAAPSVQASVGRGDLESLTRLSIEKICAAFGVPSDLVYSAPGGRGQGAASAQMQLLSKTVADLAKSLDSVLTAAYRTIYGSAGGNGKDVQLKLLITPVVDRTEISQLYTAGLIPKRIAMPLVMASVGVSREEIAQAMQDEENAQKTPGAGRATSSAATDQNGARESNPVNGDVA